MGGQRRCVRPKKVLMFCSGHLQGVAGHVPLHMGEDVLGRQAAAPGLGGQAPGGHGPSRSRFVQGALHIGKFPQSRQQSGVRPLPQGHPALPQQQKDGFFLHPPGLFGPLHRQALRRAPCTAQAQRPHRAILTPRRSIGRAYRGPQFHSGLIENTNLRLLFRHHGLEGVTNRPLHPGVGDVVVTVCQAGENPQHIAVHRCLPPAKGR